MKTLVLILCVISNIAALELKKVSTCQTALGMQSGSIPDSAISVSSSYDPTTVGPKASRARTEQYGGAWCPLNQITSIPNEWLQIEFENLTYLTQVETQGRFDNGRGKEFADYYILMYTRSNEKNLAEQKWIQYKMKNSSWIRANQNTHMGEIRLLSPPIIAKRLRFYPVSSKSRTVCLRVEVYGCVFSDGLISYSMAQGRQDINSFGDDTYDGNYIASSNMLIDGLGQLSDGITGSEDISIIDGRQPWIGWTNESKTHISILFQFDSIRLINRVTIHTSNLFSKDIFIFKTAVISFSLEKDEPNDSNAIIYQHHRDEIFEIARPILIELKNHRAKFVRLDLYFDSKWILISEVTFDSQISPEKLEKKSEKVTRQNSNGDGRKRNREISTTTISPVLTIELSLAFVIGTSLAISLLLIGSLIWILRQKKKLKFQKLTENSSRYAYPTLPVREFYDLNAPVSSAMDDREYAVPEPNFYSTFSPKHHFHSPQSFRAQSTSINSYPTLKSIRPCCVPELVFPPIEASCGNSLMIKITPNNRSISLKEIPKDQLIFLEKIADGAFGFLHLAELKAEKQTVLVKSLRDDASNEQKILFHHEIETLAELNDVHLCSFLGILDEQRTVAIFQFYPLDLYQYLRQQSIPMDNLNASSFLLSLACQLASAMKYLSSQQIVHRDLAARNCLICPSNLQIHLTDIAMAKNTYANDYARVGRFQSRIAIRWAGWESIFLNQFSSASDVWSFAVTLYEFYTYARQRPYHMLTNEEFVRQFAISSFHLPQPELCSKEIYDMMCECWQRDVQRRPSFNDIHTFLIGRAAGSTLFISTRSEL